MDLKELGNSGVMVPEIGIGVWRYSGGVEPLRRGIELGACLIDTAEVYGTEDVVAAAVGGNRDPGVLPTQGFRAPPPPHHRAPAAGARFRPPGNGPNEPLSN